MRQPRWSNKLINNPFFTLRGKKKDSSTMSRPAKQAIKAKPSMRRYEGYFDGVLASGEPFGWAYDKDEPLQRIPVYFTVNGVFIGTTEASLYRDDLASAQKADGHCGFVFAKILPETIGSLKPNSQLRAFFDRDCRQELPHSPLPLTEEMAAKLYLLALDPDRNELSPGGQKIALQILLNDLPQFNDDSEALPVYRQILGFCRILLQQGEYQWLRQQLSLTAMRDRCNQGLPVFELMLTRAIAGQALGELAEPDLSLLETALHAKLPELQKQVTDAVYPNPLRDMIVWGFMDSHLLLLNKATAIGEFSYRFLHLLTLALANLYGDYPLAGNVMETLRRNSDVMGNVLWLEQSAKINRCLEKNFEALQDLAAAIKADSQSAWAHQEAAVLQASLCEGRAHVLRQHLPELLALFFTSYQYNPQRGSVVQHHVDHLLRRFFQDCTGDTARMARTGAIPPALTQRRKDIKSLIAALVSSQPLTGQGYYQGPATQGPFSPRHFRHILFIGSQNLWQCYLYRVEQKMEQAHGLGYQTAYRDIDTLDDETWKNDLVFADAVYICRVPAVYTICKLIAYAQRLRIPVIYDIDDYLFDERYFPAPLESYAGTIDQALHTHLIMDNPFFEYALRLADIITCSTPPLAEKITAVVGPDKPVAVHPNLLDPKLYQTARQANRPEKTGNGIEIFYGSATKAHKQVIYEVFGPALRQILQRFPHVKFTAFGYFQLPEELAPYADRIEFREPTSNRGYYLQQLSLADINIAALEPDPFTDCKSEIKWLEAAVYGIPSIVTPTATYRAALTPGQHVLFAADSKAWLEQLSRLVESPGLRRLIGDNARNHAIEHFNPTVGASILDHTLKKATAQPATTLNQSAKPRLLYVNVWFAPQAVGGATRVFESHVRLLMENYGDTYELLVLTSQLHPEHCAPYSAEQFYYGTVLVTRLNVPLRDWSEIHDPQVYAFCLEFFLKQHIGLIHFHALPVMTAAPVAAARKLAIPYLITLHDGWWLSKSMFLIDDGGQPVDSRLAFAKPEDPARQQPLYDCLADARALLAVSDKFRQVYVQAGIRQTQTNENGLDLFTLLPRTPSATGKVRIAHIGGMARHKGYQLFKEAVLQTDLKHIEVHIIDHGLEAGQSYQGQWGNTPVFFRSKYQQADINTLYANMDVLVAPSIWPEAYGLVTREAAYAGVWAIASDRGAVGDCIDDGLNGRIVPVDDVRGLRQALLEIDGNPQAFLKPCPQKTPRSVAEQVSECVALYRAILADIEGVHAGQRPLT